MNAVNAAEIAPEDLVYPRERLRWFSRCWSGWR